MADAPDSKSGAFTGLWVQVPSPVPVIPSIFFGEVARHRRAGNVAERARLSATPPLVADWRIRLWRRKRCMRFTFCSVKN